MTDKQGPCYWFHKDENAADGHLGRCQQQTPTSISSSPLNPAASAFHPTAQQHDQQQQDQEALALMHRGFGNEFNSGKEFNSRQDNRQSSGSSKSSVNVDLGPPTRSRRGLNDQTRTGSRGLDADYQQLTSFVSQPTPVFPPLHVQHPTPEWNQIRAVRDPSSVGNLGKPSHYNSRNSRLAPNYQMTSLNQLVPTSYNPASQPPPPEFHNNGPFLQPAPYTKRAPKETISYEIHQKYASKVTISNPLPWPPHGIIKCILVGTARHAKSNKVWASLILENSDASAPFPNASPFPHVVFTEGHPNGAEPSLQDMCGNERRLRPMDLVLHDSFSWMPFPQLMSWLWCLLNLSSCKHSAEDDWCKLWPSGFWANELSTRS